MSSQSEHLPGDGPGARAAAGRGNRAFAVVVPARNAGDCLDACLSAITREMGSRGELIVVDDGSTDATASIAAGHGARVVSLPGRGPAAARNAGVSAAAAPVVVFFDSDCVPLPGCIDALLAPFANPAVSAVRGAYTTSQRSAVARFVQLELDEKQERLARSTSAAFVDTACAAFRRDRLLSHGGFDEGFRLPSAEDVDISFRLRAAGELLVYAPSALVAHRHPDRLGPYCRRKFRFGVNRVRVYRRFPGRLRGDGYTPRVMPLQILLAPAVLALAVLSVPFPGLWPLVLAGVVLFLGTSAPLAARAWKTGRGIVPLVPLMLAARSLAQAAGLAAGLKESGSRAQRPSIINRLGFAISLAALAGLALLLWSAGWRDALRPVASARVDLLLLALALALTVEVVKTVRWALLLGAGGSTVPRLLGVVLGSRLINALAPLRAGDAWRIAAVARMGRQPVVAVGATVVVEKALDGASLAVVALLLGGAAVGRALEEARSIGALAALAALAVVVLLAGRRTRLGLKAATSLNAISGLVDARRLALASILTVLSTGCGTLVNMAVAVGLGMPADWTVAAVMLLSAYAAGLVPSAPGQLGTFEVAVGGALAAAGLAAAPALAAAVTLHAVLIAGLAVGGLLALALGGSRTQCLAGSGVSPGPKAGPLR